MQVVWDDGTNTGGNPCAVVDETTGTIWLLMRWDSASLQREADLKAGFGPDSRRVFVTHSNNEGQTWAEATEITSTVKLAPWSWYATGPGSGSQITRGQHRGRLVIPCDHKVPTGDAPLYYSHIIYSDDHGATWKLGGRTPEPAG